MKLGILKETAPYETRVALVPETAAKFIKDGVQVLVQKCAGELACISDQDYEKAGAALHDHASDILAQADMIAKVQKPTLTDVALLKSGSILMAPCYPLQNQELLAALNAKKITVFSLDMIPRIARAQSMDILSSQTSIAGYKSIIIAAHLSGKLFPMMTTAAGTIPPLKVIVIGAGVAGLQAIATARRLGAVVIAFDTRPATSEQVKSLGADFVSLETSHTDSEDAGGYAKERSTEFYKAEQEILLKYLPAADVVVTTALIPGKRAPLLITEDMVASMKKGAIIIDLASEQMGNCALTKANETINAYGVTIVGSTNLPGEVPVHASLLFAKNIFSFIHYLLPQLTIGTFDLSDELIKGCLICQSGEILHPLVKQSLKIKGETHAA